MDEVNEPVLDVSQLARSARARVPRDAARLLIDEPPERIEEVLALLPASRVVRIRRHLNSGQLGTTESQVPAPDSLAELMDEPDGLIALDASVGDAIEYLRCHPRADDITYLYVVSALGKLLGLVVIRDLLLAEPEASVRSIMLRRPFSIRVGMPLDEAIEAAVYRQYPVYPVVDDEDRLIGLVRGWELFEQQKVQISAQSGQMVGVPREERVTTPVLRAFKLRHPWLQLNLVTAFLAAFVVSQFEDTIARIVVLAAFLPVLAGQSGNNGSQTLAITLRGLTLGDIRDVTLRQLLGKEVLLGALNGLLTGVVAALVMWFSASQAQPTVADPLALALVILLAMTGACMASGFFGVTVPLLLRRLGADPATASSIFLTTGTDIAGMGLMLSLATLIVL